MSWDIVSKMSSRYLEDVLRLSWDMHFTTYGEIEEIQNDEVYVSMAHGPSISWINKLLVLTI